MDDRDHQGELFGVKNLFTLREDGLGIKEAAQRIEEIELDVTGAAANYKYEEYAVNDLKVRRPSDVRALTLPR